MRPLTVDELVTKYGYSRGAAEIEVTRANCTHDFGDVCDATFLGCVRRCVKCGQLQGLGRYCSGVAEREGLNLGVRELPIDPLPTWQRKIRISVSGVVQRVKRLFGSD